MPRRSGERYASGTDPFYLSPAWKRIKRAVLARDHYQDIVARRYGRMIPAELVHHVFTLEDFPALRLDPRNLVSVSRETHHKLHTSTGDLTQAGRDLQRLIIRRYPELLPIVSGSPGDLEQEDARGEAGGATMPRQAGA